MTMFTPRAVSHLRTLAEAPGAGCCHAATSFADTATAGATPEREPRPRPASAILTRPTGLPTKIVPAAELGGVTGQLGFASLAEATRSSPSPEGPAACYPHTAQEGEAVNSLTILWKMSVPDSLTPAQVDADLRRHGLDPQEVRGLINTLNQDLGVAFATGVLAGIRLGLTCGRRRLPGSRRTDHGSCRVIPFPGATDLRASGAAADRS